MCIDNITDKLLGLPCIRIASKAFKKKETNLEILVPTTYLNLYGK